jgi:hypothetical protein
MAKGAKMDFLNARVLFLRAMLIPNPSVYISQVNSRTFNNDRWGSFDSIMG